MILLFWGISFHIAELFSQRVIKKSENFSSNAKVRRFFVIFYPFLSLHWISIDRWWQNGEGEGEEGWRERKSTLIIESGRWRIQRMMWEEEVNLLNSLVCCCCFPVLIKFKMSTLSRRQNKDCAPSSLSSWNRERKTPKVKHNSEAKNSRHWKLFSVSQPDNSRQFDFYRFFACSSSFSRCCCAVHCLRFIFWVVIFSQFYCFHIEKGEQQQQPRNESTFGFRVTTTATMW